MASQLEPPNLSEVIRRLDQLSLDLKEYSGRFVSTEIYMLDKQAHDREAAARGERITVVESAMATFIRQNGDEQDAREIRSQTQGSQNRAIWIVLVVSPIVSAVLAWIINGGLHS